MRARFTGGFCVVCRGRIFAGQEIVVDGPRKKHADCVRRGASTLPGPRQQRAVASDGKWEGRRDLW